MDKGLKFKKYDLGFHISCMDIVEGDYGSSFMLKIVKVGRVG